MEQVVFSCRPFRAQADCMVQAQVSGTDRRFSTYPWSLYISHAAAAEVKRSAVGSIPRLAINSGCWTISLRSGAMRSRHEGLRKWGRTKGSCALRTDARKTSSQKALRIIFARLFMAISRGSWLHVDRPSPQSYKVSERLPEGPDHAIKHAIGYKQVVLHCKNGIENSR